MDGVSTDIYERLPRLKSKNPNLKVMIALGGWTFNDPGPWQSVFPSLTSTSGNRATFIKNLLGFLDQYGFDGVDFDVSTSFFGLVVGRSLNLLRRYRIVLSSSELS